MDLENFLIDMDYPVQDNYCDQDIHAVVEDKKKLSLLNGVIFSGEKNSQAIEFTIPRFYDGIDLISKTINVCYVKDGVGQGDMPINVKFSDTTIKCTWVVPYSITHEACKVMIGLMAFGKEYGEEYIWKSDVSELEVRDSFVYGSGLIEPDTNWYDQFLIMMQDAGAKVIEIVKSYTDATIGTIDNNVSKAESSAEKAESAKNTAVTLLQSLVDDTAEARDLLIDISDAIDTFETPVEALAIMEQVKEQVEENTDTITDHETRLAQNEEEITNARRTLTIDSVQSDLKERIDVDINNLLQRIQGSTTIPYDGEYINADNTYLGLTSGLKIEGKTYQNIYPSDNIPTVSQWGGTLDIDYTLEASNGNIVFKKIPNSKANYNWLHFKFGDVKDMIFKPDTAYTIVGVFTNIIDITLKDGEGKDRISSIAQINSENTGVQKLLLRTTSDFNPIKQFVYLGTVDQNTNTEFSVQNFMILEGDYTNVDLPSTITGIESVSSPVIKSVGKNLLQLKEEYLVTNVGLTGVINDDGSITVNGTPSNSYAYVYSENNYQLENGTYILKESLSENMLVQLSILKTSGNTTYYTSDTNVVVKINNDEISSIRVSVQMNNSTETVTNVTLYPQIELGSTATDYEPYTESSITVEDLDLRSLPDGTCDYVSVEENGWWECVGVYKPTSVDEVILPSSSILGGVRRCFIELGTTSIQSIAFSNVFPYLANYTSETEHFYVSSDGRLLIFIDTEKASSDTEVKSWLVDNNAEFYYPLETPIFHPLPLETLKSFDGTTHVFSEGSNVKPSIKCRIPSDVGAVTSSVMQTNAQLQSENNVLRQQNEEITNAIIEQGGMMDV